MKTIYTLSILTISIVSATLAATYTIVWEKSPERQFTAYEGSYTYYSLYGLDLEKDFGRAKLCKDGSTYVAIAANMSLTINENSSWFNISEGVEHKYSSSQATAKGLTEDTTVAQLYAHMQLSDNHLDRIGDTQSTSGSLTLNDAADNTKGATKSFTFTEVPIAVPAEGSN